MVDPYALLGVTPRSSDEEVRAAYRRLVKLHHPDHNRGDPEAARRFEAVQEAYAEIQRRRRGHAPTGRPAAQAPPPTGQPRATAQPDPELDARLADLERQVREAHEARERAQRAAREAAAAAASTRTDRERPSDEELGYIKTDDSLGKILGDAVDELAERLGHGAGRGEGRHEDHDGG